MNKATTATVTLLEHRRTGGMFLLVQEDGAGRPPRWLWQIKAGWAAYGPPPGLEFLPADFDDSDLQSSGYTVVRRSHYERESA